MSEPSEAARAEPPSPRRPGKPCACTGVRWCAHCRDPHVRAAHGMDAPLPLPPFLERPPRPGRFGGAKGGSWVVELRPGPRGLEPVGDGAPEAEAPVLRGVRLLPELVTRAEAARLLEAIGRERFRPSQSGKSKQHYGARVNFSKRRMRPGAFAGLPGYGRWLEARMRARLAADAHDAVDAGLAVKASAGLARALADFETTDVFVLRYRAGDRANLDFHVDDVFAYGELILDLSLESDGVMTFLRPRIGGDGRFEGWDCVRVGLPARSMLLVHGPARFEWEHAILPFDVAGQRTSITLRTLGAALRRTPDGRRVRARARRTLSSFY